MMKTIKNLIGVVLLVMLTTSAFSKNPFMPQKHEIPFSKLKYHSLTTSYSVHLEVERTIFNGTHYSYDIHAYITDTATPGFSNRLTVPGDFTISGTATIVGIPVPSYVIIYSGTDEGITSTGYIPGAPVLSNISFSVNSYNGIPIYFDTNVVYY